ncbi:nucleoside monophosphate kinase [bacterium]|nr:nucleoside monophosphate kinase [bacterium]
MKTILFHGPSGCGKDTQVELLENKYHFENIGTGEMFRKMYAQGNPDAIKARQYWLKGEFVPNELTYRMLEDWIKQFDQRKNWAFVSVIRDPGQIPLFEEVLANTNRKLDYFVHFVLSEEASIKRMSLRWVCPNCEMTYHEQYKKESVKGVCDKCGEQLVQREDDKPEKIRMRLMEYNKTIEPILEHFRQEGVLVEIDASPSIEDIHKELIKKLELQII